MAQSNWEWIMAAQNGSSITKGDKLWASRWPKYRRTSRRTNPTSTTVKSDNPAHNMSNYAYEWCYETKQMKPKLQVAI